MVTKERRDETKAMCAKLKKKTRFTYYSKSSKCRFFVLVLDEDGKPLAKRHPHTGLPIMSGSKTVLAEEAFDFSPVVVQRSGKSDALCFFTVESTDTGAFTPQQKEIISTLEDLSDDSSVPIMREKDWKKNQNPEAFLKDEKIAELESEHKTIVESKDSEIAELKRKLAENEALLDSASEPKKK